MSSKDIIVLSGLSFLIMLFAYWFFGIMNNPESFISFKEEEIPINIEEVAKEEYLAELDRRNKIKMAKSYDELMGYAAQFRQQKNYYDEAACYFFAKTIYPKREKPRRLLSEAYMRLCAEYGEYCGDAKKEIYFAFKYVPDSSVHYPDLLDMATAMDLYPYIDQDESNVLPMIYEEKKLSNKF